MAGYNGLGVSRKEIVQKSGSSLDVYELVVDDIYDGYAFDMREELLNHMILVKSTVTNNMVSVFIPKTMGEDDDVIKFKLIDDLHDAGGDTPYIDFWGEDWAEDINVNDLGINNVDETDGFYWIMESQNEAFFKKVNGEWKVIRDKGVFDLNEFKNPRFGELNVRNLNADNYLSFKVKDNYVLSLNFDKVMLDKLVQFREHLYSIYYDFQPEKTDIGLINKPFGDLYLKGNAISSEPTEDNHLATKKYVDENGGIAKLEDDLAPKLSAILDCNYKKLVNVQNPSSTYDGVNKGYVDPFRIYSNSTNLNGASTHTIVAGEFNTILVVENTIASSLDMTIQPAVGNFVDIFNDTEFDLTIISSNGINIRSLNNNVKIPKYGKATLKSGGGYYMLYGDLKA